MTTDIIYYIQQQKHGKKEGLKLSRRCGKIHRNQFLDTSRINKISPCRIRPREQIPFTSLMKYAAKETALNNNKYFYVGRNISFVFLIVCSFFLQIANENNEIILL